MAPMNCWAESGIARKTQEILHRSNVVACLKKMRCEGAAAREPGFEIASYLAARGLLMGCLRFSQQERLMNCAHRRWTRHAASAAIAMALCAATALAQAQSDGEPAWEALRQGAVLLVRHANAPGVGDPADFKLGDCRTQRNLDQTGRKQAKRLGDQFVRRRIAVGAVLASQWCRTKDTAELAFPNRVREDASFNSFFGDSASQPAQTAAALNTLNRWRGPGALVVVTHQVNITALTGVVPASSEGVVVRSKAGGIEVVGRVTP